MKFKKITDPIKQKKLWDKLIIGEKEFEDCGEPWDEWNTKIIPERIKAKELKREKKYLKTLKLYDTNKDGIISIEDFNDV